ncbi:WD40 repeat domain-containing protein [Microcoleus vaginatus PCC 9802]|uniref:WD40 repeat domain-containing protein n=1 Tax=Microcoleus vaginatus TaxID=119532 RepID=UPI00020D2F6F|nr:WD40 repeat-containing protein [Microcoleus vaginatus FGP-2]UNU18009.1 WD40 repeat domain-containing protein [Microcoleus vaginatus PCC 9802]
MMADNPNQPREYDAVLGGQSQIPIAGAVLGGIAGVKQRFNSPSIESRIAAVKDAPKYGGAGLNLAIEALLDPAAEVQRVAYLILRSRTEPLVRQALKDFVPYKLFDCIRTVKTAINVAISPGGYHTASLHGKIIRICDVETGEILYTVDKYPRAQETFVLCQESEVFVRSRNTPKHRAIEIWQGGELRHTSLGHEGEITAIVISPDSQVIASGSADTTIKIWNLETGKLICTFGNLLTWGSHKAGIVSLAFSPIAHSLASSSSDGTIKLWNLRSRECFQTIKGYANCLAFSPDGQTLATGGWDRNIQLRQLSNPDSSITLAGHFNSINAIAFTADGRTVISASADGNIKFWNASTGENIHTLRGHQNSVTCLTFSSDGETIISGSIDKTVKSWGVN